MAVFRANAVTGDQVILDIEIRDPLTCALEDLESVYQVEILNAALAVVETISGISVIHVSTGIYRVLCSEIDTAGTYYDKWYVVEELGDPVTTRTQTITVSDPPAVPVPGTGVYSVRVDVIETVPVVYGFETPSEIVAALKDIQVLVSDADTGQRLQTDYTNGQGRVYFNLGVGDYTFSIRDASNSYRLFDQNNKDHSVVDPDLSTAAADPNIVVFEGASFEPEWSPGTPLDGTDLCTVTTYFVDLAGQPLRGLKVFVRNKFSPSIRSSKGVLGDNSTFTTDNTGLISMVLVREAEVTVSIEGTGIVRDITIPDSSTANLLTLMGSEQDLFTIVQDNTLVLSPRP